MKPFPHLYRATAAGGPLGAVVLTSESLPALETAPPVEFDGPGDLWSPETLLLGAIADCFVLTFRAIAKASSLSWSQLEANASGTLERTREGTRFTAVHVEAALTVPDGTKEGQASRLLAKAERGCLVTNSLACETSLTAKVTVA